ncbi:MAG: GGDEF domain-containing protein [Terracidiphilus sp.]
MKRLIPIFAIVLGGASSALAATPAPLTSLVAVSHLTNEQAAQSLPAAFEATVLYYRNYEKTLFVQDGDAAIYVQPTTNLKLLPGDRILIRGTTEPSFRPFVKTSDIQLLHHGALPVPIPATYDDMIRSKFDCMLVSVHARVRAADMVLSSEVSNVNLQLLTDGGAIEAIIDSADSKPFDGLLDADVEITGVAAGKFDGKMQQTGVLLHVQTWDGVKVLKRADTTPAALPVTPMDQILTGYHVRVMSQRVRVHGSVTYYQPGSEIVLQNGSKSLWIQTQSRVPVQIGDVADVTGFPGLHDGFLTLTNGEIQDSHIQAPVAAQSSTWRRLSMSGHVFDLVSIEGEVVTEVPEAAQDEYILLSDGQLFSAIVRHPPSTSSLASNSGSSMRQIPLNSKVRVTGICRLDDSNPFDVQVPFTILMRSYDDINVVANPSLLNVRNLLIMVAFLLVVVFAGGARGWTLERKVRRQTATLAARIEAEAALDHRMAQIEQRRSRILEDINGSRPLAEILEEIAALICFQLDGIPCWCDVTDGARLGTRPSSPQSLRVVSELIPARNGAPLGALYAAFDPAAQPSAIEAEALSLGAGMATLAIETRRLYSDLLHRSEFDLLTDIHNRFSLDKRLDAQIELARLNAGIFGLIYIDLDEFKQVNDIYGHQVGDLYLQEVSIRMKRQLRGGDLLARLGGDEFAALICAIPSRAGVEEIAHRLERCFDEPFSVEGYVLHGSASVGIALYPEDGATRDSLLSAADAAMYVAKHTRHSRTDAADRQRGELIPKPRF